MIDAVREVWVIIATVVAIVVWLVRLEARGFANAAEIKRLWTQRKEDLADAKERRARTDKRLDEIGQDIKTLLRGLDK